MGAVKELTEQRMRELMHAPATSLAELVDSPVQAEIEGDNGATYRMKTHAFWDAEPWESDLLVRVKTTRTGRRALGRYYGVESRGPERDFAPIEGSTPDVQPTLVEVLAWGGCALILLGALGGLILLVTLIFYWPLTAAELSGRGLNPSTGAIEWLLRTRTHNQLAGLDLV